jgi:hypothetical protein
LRAKSATRADEDDGSWQLDAQSDMLIYQLSSDDELRLEEFFI